MSCCLGNHILHVGQMRHNVGKKNLSCVISLEAETQVHRLKVISSKEQSRNWNSGLLPPPLFSALPTFLYNFLLMRYPRSNGWQSSMFTLQRASKKGILLTIRFFWKTKHALFHFHNLFKHLTYTKQVQFNFPACPRNKTSLEL